MHLYRLASPCEGHHLFSPNALLPSQKGLSLGGDSFPQMTDQFFFRLLMCGSLSRHARHFPDFSPGAFLPDAPERKKPLAASSMADLIRSASDTSKLSNSPAHSTKDGNLPATPASALAIAQMIWRITTVSIFVMSVATASNFTMSPSKSDLNSCL